MRLSKYVDWAVSFVSHKLEKECLWLYSPCFQFPAEIPTYILIQSLLCFITEIHACYTTFSELHRPSKGHSFFLLQFQSTLSNLSLFLFNLSNSLLLWLFKIIYIELFVIHSSNWNHLTLLTCCKLNCLK